jgi:hypothetical protein
MYPHDANHLQKLVAGIQEEPMAKHAVVADEADDRHVLAPALRLVVVGERARLATPGRASRAGSAS